LSVDSYQLVVELDNLTSPIIRQGLKQNNPFFVQLLSVVITARTRKKAKEKKHERRKSGYLSDAAHLLTRALDGATAE
jgi:hypothetical protein